MIAGPKFLSVGKMTKLLLFRRLYRVVLCIGNRLLPLLFGGLFCLIDFKNSSIRTRYSIGISGRGGVQELRMNSFGVGFDGVP